MFTLKFWADVIERTVKTFAQTLGGILSADGIMDSIELEWDAYLAASALAALVAFLMGVAGGKIGSERTAAWLPSDVDTERGQTRDVILVAVIAAAATTLLLLYLVDRT